MTIWDFANQHPFIGAFIVLVLAYAATRPFSYAFRAYNRRLRSRNIVAHGWPEPPLDADGDVVYPEKSP